MGDESAPAFVTDMPQYQCLQQILICQAVPPTLKLNDLCCSSLLAWAAVAQVTEQLQFKFALACLGRRLQSCQWEAFASASWLAC